MFFSSRNRFRLTVLGVLVLGAALASAQPAAEKPTGGSATPTAAASVKPTTTAAKVTVIERKIGEGPAAASGEPVLVHYTGYLFDASALDQKGKAFDSSLKRPAPLGFIIGAGRVIKGWDEGITGMQVGGQRTLIIPPEKGYGERGAGATIPPNSTLVFDVELMGIIGKTQNPKAEPSPYVPAKKEPAAK